MNIELMGLNWQPGDELVTASSEHGGALNPIALIKQRLGVRIHYTPIGLRDYDPVEELARVLSPRTKRVSTTQENQHNDGCNNNDYRHH